MCDPIYSLCTTHCPVPRRMIVWMKDDLVDLELN